MPRLFLAIETIEGGVGIKKEGESTGEGKRRLIVTEKRMESAR